MSYGVIPMRVSTIVFDIHDYDNNDFSFIILDLEELVTENILLGLGLLHCSQASWHEAHG
jgi:hypothetical protein